MNVFVIPSWYPSREHPISGIFVKEEVECIAEIHPEFSITVSLDGGSEYNLDPRRPFKSLALVFRYLKTAKYFSKSIAPNLRELHRPQLKWPALIFDGNMRRLINAHRQNFLDATQKFGRPELIHAHVTYPAGWVAMKLAQEFGVPFIIKECMGPFPFRIKKFLDNKGALTKWIREPLERAAEVIAMSPQLAEDMVGYGLRRPIVVPYPVDERRFELRPYRRRRRFQFFTLSALSPEKGVPDLLRAIPAALRERPDLHFWIGGSGRKDEYVQLAQSLGIASAVEWLGPVSREDAPEYFSKCDAFIMLSHLETFGMVYAEAIACGKPVIATRCGGAEFIINENNGLLVDVANVGQVINAIIQMHDEVDKFKATEIRDEFLERFSRKAVVQKIARCYKNTTENVAVGGEKQSKKTLLGDSFPRHTLTLVGGAVIAQGISMAVMPLLTRLYIPSDFALLTVYVGIVSMLGVVVAGRYEMTILHAANSVEADRLTMLALTSALLMSLVLGVGSALFSQPIAGLMGLPELGAWMFWLAVPVFATGVMQILSNRLNWQKSYAHIARGRVIQNGSTAATSLGLGVIKLGGGMLMGHVVGLWCVVLYFLKKSKVDFRAFDRKEILLLARRYLHYPMYSAPAALLDIASMYACIFILGHFYSKDILGQFSLTHRLLLVPMVFVGAAVAQTFFRRAAECYRQGDDLRSLLWATSKKLLIYSLPLFAMFALLAPALFGLIFGSSWHEAGEYARWLALAYWVRLGVSPISTIFMVVHRVKVGTLWQIIYFCSSFTVLSLAAWAGMQIMPFLLLYAVHEVLLYGLYFWMALKVCDSSKQI